MKIQIFKIKLPRWVWREWLAFFAVLLFLLGMLWYQYALHLRQTALVQQVAQLEHELKRLERTAKVDLTQNAGIARMPDLQQQNLDYLAGFPPERALKQVLQDMRRLADDGALTADQATYRTLLKHPLAELGQYEITSPLRGSYPQVKRYLQTLLNAHPTLAVQEISMQRAKITDPQIELDVRWVFYFKVAQ